MSSPHPLDGALLKVIRADQHLKAFEVECGRYIQTKPYKVVSNFEGDVISVEGVITAEPPPSLACIVGDFVTNLRAALDYIAWELAMKAGRNLTDQQRRKVTFPLASNEANFTKADGTAAHLENVCGVPAEAIGVIESVQPYHAGYQSLGSLDLLVRTDKHRALLLCGSFMESAGAIAIYHGSSLAWKASGMTRMEMNLAAFSPPRGPASEYRVEVEEEPTLLVALKDFPSPPTLTYVGVLENILKCVTNIIPRFKQFF